MKRIAEGNFDITVNEQGNPEFTQLSESINKMVNSICQKIKENEQLLKRQKADISDMSIAIEKIIGEITSIAQQTNILSLNASIEAAKASEVGRGFAVVATQVGELASRSSLAAKETNELIKNSIHAVENGKKITNQTVDAFEMVVKNIKKASQDVEEITQMVQQNVDIVTDAASQIEKISHVVEQNVQISHDTKQVSSNMADITGNLLKMVET